MIKNLLLFTDGSVNVQLKIGYGACLLINENELADEKLNHQVKTKRFENTSSTKLELQTLLWAFSEFDTETKNIVVCTDSQNIIQLINRRQRLELNNFYSKKGELLKQHELYKEFYQKIDENNCSFVKIRGHQPTKYKNEIERIFTLVDMASRKALRQATKEIDDRLRR